MVTIGILEQRPVLSALLERCLPAPLREQARLLPAAGLPPAQPADLLVVSPDLRPAPLPALAGRILLIPGRLSAAAGAVSAGWTVSYGSSPRDSLTFSSLLDDRISLALQREIVTLTGLRLERQEFPLPFSGRVPPHHLLACAGVQLLLDLPPARIRADAGGRAPTGDSGSA